MTNLHRIRKYHYELGKLLTTDERLTTNERDMIKAELSRVGVWLDRESKAVRCERDDWGGESGY